MFVKFMKIGFIGGLLMINILKGYELKIEFVSEIKNVIRLIKIGLIMVDIKVIKYVIIYGLLILWK